ncbi:polysaccharide biosynthesis protein [Staphylococcus pseudintermedius]|uniref:polysaccharide biosynthesis protein n=1 Tax=Staphylococcus pseudintermedius TaxID=283734 RepID=UPI0007AE82F5|nr:nucleoside-diphosphate sugar epimerase/dehydratase [Staphylococcus pseudintermedius]EGQ1625767.1 polysaccharide biosynthesis protein [Staphylococcus pseudintermedius]EGQ1662125.1 polysaccharide biosynthesis protein [Staphylococcus pseudintermedius]EGQ2816764.1 polysaccharide biosynthesis protein [Staphylococcus pseudintermedius]EGQ3547429.1 polysaccharide biosynthesis protein [Staphylococcus pseudintermedius]EGQ3824007.1 polysaccharide biosynthesis protein [Staphylococcus pseudintermedius]
MTKLTVKQRFALLIMVDSLIVTFSVFLGYYILEPYFQNYSRNLLLFSSVSLLITHHIYAYIFNIYHRAWEYASVTELILIVKSVTYAVLTTMFIVFLLMNGSVFIRLYLITWMMNLILIGGSRLSWRVYRRAVMKNDYKKIPTLIVGAGQGGLLLMRQMTRNPYMGIEPVAIVDDDPNKQNMSLTSNIKVEGTIDDIPSLVKRYQIKKLIIAIPTLSKARLKDISALTGNLNIEVLKMPNIENVMTGEVEVSQLKKVSVEDLLGREPVELDMHMISQGLTRQTILVTGAGGSIGSEICRQVCQFKPKRIVLVGHGENSIYLIHQELTNAYKETIDIIPVIADIQDRERMFQIMKTYQPFIVYHAAAHKHVPLMECNPEEAVKNNIIGTRNTAEAAQYAKVRKFVMISTDKAVNPPNVMGASKRVAEMVIQSLNDASSETDFVAVRFGNVLGSRGSVIPLFKKQIESGGPVTVTHPEMTRYFMTIPEASRLVLQAGVLAEGGEVFVLDMGEPVKIVDLAKNLIRLSGKREEDIGIEFSGVRPGEKLYEELLNEGEIHPEQVYEKIYRGKVSRVSKEDMLYITNVLKTNFSKKDILDIANDRWTIGLRER